MQFVRVIHQIMNQVKKCIQFNIVNRSN